MATPQNLRAFKLTGESLDGGPGNLRVIIWPPLSSGGPTPSTQTVNPFIQTIEILSTDISALQSAWTQKPLTSGETWIKNQNPWWLTFNGTGNGIVYSTFAAATNVPFVASIPPYGLWAVPDNWLTFTAAVTGLPTDGNQPLATSTTLLYLDLIQWG